MQRHVVLGAAIAGVAGVLAASPWSGDNGLLYCSREFFGRTCD
jgi:hypothetical protein